MKGVDFIDPVPLESPDVCPPPKELAETHFNDWTLAFEQSKFRPNQTSEISTESLVKDSEPTIEIEPEHQGPTIILAEDDLEDGEEYRTALVNSGFTVRGPYTNTDQTIKACDE